MPFTKFCMFQHEKYNLVTTSKSLCNCIKNEDGVAKFWCPFKTEAHAKYICHYYSPLPLCDNQNPSIEERLDKLEQAMKCLQVILKKE